MKKSFFLLFFFLLISVRGLSQDECPCCTESHTAFDFWVGEWRVTSTDGSFVGTNTIEKIEDGCVLKESWRGASGTTGTSINFYNGASGKWEQLWVDNSGSNLKLFGNIKGNQMVLSSAEFVDSDGKKAFHRITWTPNEDGTVRQLWEVVREGNKTSISFDGLYHRVEK